MTSASESGVNPLLRRAIDAFAKDFIADQSSGEWGDRIEAEDAEKLADGIEKLFILAQGKV